MVTSSLFTSILIFWPYTIPFKNNCSDTTVILLGGGDAAAADHSPGRGEGPARPVRKPAIRWFGAEWVGPRDFDATRCGPGIFGPTRSLGEESLEKDPHCITKHAVRGKSRRNSGASGGAGFASRVDIEIDLLDVKRFSYKMLIKNGILINL